MIQADSHCHTFFSPDSKSDFTDLIREAEQIGLKALTFTDHAEFTKEDQLCLDIKAYRKKFYEIKAAYTGPLKLYWGVEVGIRLDKPAEVCGLLNDYDFDFIIGSVHRIGADGVFDRTLYEKGYSKNALHHHYLEETLEAISFYDHFHALGHMDFIARYGGSAYMRMEWEHHMDLVEAIFNVLINRQIALEVNTAGFRYDLNAPHPEAKILDFYYHMGGRLITVGSDSHTVDSVGGYFEETHVLLKEIGFKETCVFEKGKPLFLPL